MTIRFDGRVAIVTGAGNGLGRSHAISLAELGARVVVNDLGGSVDGSGASSEAAERVAEEIRARGGEAIANGANVTDMGQVEAMVEAAIAKWGRVDILVNNAGILRDRSFAKMSAQDFRTVVDVHLIGAFNCCKAVWEHMRAQNYGRIIMTTSASGLYGNFGQSNYAAAKMGQVGLMNVLHLEGAKYGIRVNALSPTAGTRMTEGLVPPAVMDLMTVESVTPALLFLASEGAPSKLIVCAGAGGYASTQIYETDGIYLRPEEQKPDALAARLADILDESQKALLENAFAQSDKFVKKAADALGITLT